MKRYRVRVELIEDYTDEVDGKTTEAIIDAVDSKPQRSLAKAQSMFDSIVKEAITC